MPGQKMVRNNLFCLASQIWDCRAATGRRLVTSQTREAGRGAAAVVGSAAVFHPSRPSFLRALIRGGVSSYHSPLIIGKRHRVKLKEELGDDQRRGEESGLVLARNARNASCMSHPRSRSALRGTSSLPSNPFALSHTPRESLPSV